MSGNHTAVLNDVPPPPPSWCPPWRGYIREGAPAVPLGDPTMLSFFHRTNRRFKHAFAWIHWNIIHPVLNKSSADLIRWSRDFYSPIYKCLNWDYFETCPLFVYLWKLTQLFAFLPVYPACLFVCLFFVCLYVSMFVSFIPLVKTDRSASSSYLLLPFQQSLPLLVKPVVRLRN